MSEQGRQLQRPDWSSSKQERRDFRSYVWGIGLALLLTLVPFALVHWVGIPRFPAAHRHRRLCVGADDRALSIFPAYQLQAEAGGPAADPVLDACC